MIDWIKIDENTELQHGRHLFIHPDYAYPIIAYVDKYKGEIIKIYTHESYFNITDFTHYANINLPK